MNPIQSISSVFRNYANFSGRAQRSEYWWFTLFSLITQAILNNIPFVGWIYGLALLLPSLAVTARRLHDTGRSAWWLMIYPLVILASIVAAASLFIGAMEAFGGSQDTATGWIILFVISGLVGLAGIITLLVLCAMPGIRGPNRYGPDPLQPDSGQGAPGYPYATQPDSGQRLYCTQCGAERTDDARFCVSCGVSF